MCSSMKSLPPTYPHHLMQFEHTSSPTALIKYCKTIPCYSMTNSIGVIQPYVLELETKQRNMIQKAQPLVGISSVDLLLRLSSVHCSNRVEIVSCSMDWLFRSQYVSLHRKKHHM